MGRSLVHRRPLALALAGVLGATLATLPASVGSASAPTVNATEEAGGIYGATYHWTPAGVELASPGSVTFVNGSSTVPHGIVWSGGPATPACEASVPVGAERSGTSWSGSCSFPLAGTYTFYCSVHGPSMSGTVTVSPAGTTTTTTTGAGAGPGGGPSSPPPTPAPASPAGGQQPAALSVPPSQHGPRVRGALEVPAADAGGRLEVDLLAHGKRVGRLLLSPLAAGALRFAVPLDRRARRLARRRSLRLAVRVSLTPLHGKAVTLTRLVWVRER
jgi:plastocyanin